MIKAILTIVCTLASQAGVAQTFKHYTTTEGAPWKLSEAKAIPLTSTPRKRGADATRLPIAFSLPPKGSGEASPFLAWGTCFNELDLDALELLQPEERDRIMRDLFAPEGDLRFTRGRLTMNANDYSRAWYTCDSVAGDFALKYFNIEHDKQHIIRLIKMAQRWQPH